MEQTRFGRGTSRGVPLRVEGDKRYCKKRLIELLVFQPEAWRPAQADGKREMRRASLQVIQSKRPAMG